MSRVEAFYSGFGFTESMPVKLDPVFQVRVEPGPEQPDQQQCHLGLSMEGALNGVDLIDLGFGVGQVRVGESDKRVNEGGVLAVHDPFDHEIHVCRGVG